MYRLLKIRGPSNVPLSSEFDFIARGALRWDEGDHSGAMGKCAASGVRTVGVIMHRLNARIARQLAEFRNHNTEPDYEEQARIILLIVNDERQAEIHEWRATQNERALGKAK